MWSNLEEIIDDPSHHHGNLEQITEDPRRHHEDLKEITKDPRHHHDKVPTRASPGKAENGRDDCRDHNKIPTRASPGKAADGQEGCRHHDNPFNACLGRASNGRGLSDHCIGHHYDNPLNASPGKASNGIKFQDHPCDGSPSRRTPKQLKASTTPPKEFQSIAVVIDALPIWPKNMMEIIEVIVELLNTCPEAPLFKFEMNREAAESNVHALRKFNFDVEKTLAARVGSPVGYESKFRKGELLLPLLKNHPLWNRMQEMLAHGLQLPTEPITEEDRAADLIEALKFGKPQPSQNYS